MSLVELLGRLSEAMDRPLVHPLDGLLRPCLLFFTMGYGSPCWLWPPAGKTGRRGVEHGSRQMGRRVSDRKEIPGQEKSQAEPHPDSAFQMGLDGHKHKRNLNVLVNRGQRRG